MTDAEVDLQASEEAYLRGFYDIPDDDKLQQMSDIALDSLLDSSKDNSVKAATVKREIHRRRNTTSIQNPSTYPADNKVPKTEEPKPISVTKIFESVVATIFAACLLYLIAKHFDVHLHP